MNKVKVDDSTKRQLLDLYSTRKIVLEGNILKLIDPDGDTEFETYLNEAIEKDKAIRKKRLTEYSRVQNQNTELTKLNEENVKVNAELKDALDEAETSKNDAITAKEEAEEARQRAEEASVMAEQAKEEALSAKTNAETNLDHLQKKTQYELIGRIVKSSLWVIVGIGITTTLIFSISLIWGGDTDKTNIFTTWSNVLGIMLTNAFSIIGTIMGVKYASEKKDQS